MELPYKCFVRKAGFRTTLSTTTIQSIFTVAQSCPGSSAAKESACNAGNPGLIPGWGRLPTLLFLGFPVAQLTKNLLSVQETWTWEDPVWEDALEKGRDTPLQWTV